MCIAVLIPLIAWGLMIMAANAISWAGTPRPSRAVIDDRQCLSCAYSLQGLPETAPCPECGTRERYSSFIVRRAAPPDVPWKAGLAALAGVLPVVFACSLTNSGGALLLIIALVLSLHIIMSASATTLIAIRRDPGLTRTFMLTPAAVQFLVGAFIVGAWLSEGADSSDADLVAAASTVIGMAVSMLVYFVMAVATYLSLRVLGRTAPKADDQGTP